MNVLLCIDNLGSGGSQRQLVSLALGLKKKGCTVEVFIYYPQDFFKPQLIEKGIKIISVEKKNRLGLNVILKLRNLLATEKYDFAVSYLITPNIYLSIASKLSLSKTKIITSERAMTHFNSHPIFRIRYWCHIQSFAVVFNSIHEKNNWVQHFKKLEKNSFTIYNGVDTTHFKPQAKEHKRIRKIVGVGTIGPHKNIMVLIKAIKLLKDAGEPIEVHWYGKSIDNIPLYDDYNKKALALINELGIVSVWKWCKPVKEIDKIMVQYDCLVLPSVLEGLPNVVCEAMACGLPVITSNILDHPLLVKEGIRGYLFEPDDPGELALKLKKLYLLDTESYNCMKNNCRLYAENELNLDKFINNYISLFNNKWI